MSDIAIRVDNLSKLYHIGALQQRPDTLRDALTGFLPRISRIGRNQKEKSRNSRQASQDNSLNSPNSRQASPSDELWALRDVFFEACPEFLRRIKRGEVVGTPALASGASVIGRNGAGTLAPARSAGESTLLKILSRSRAHQRHSTCIDYRFAVCLVIIESDARMAQENQ